MSKNAISNENYYVVQGWMRTELGLSGNALSIYAIIYGFSQVAHQEFTASINYLCEWLGVSRPTVINTLKDLVDKGYLTKESEEKNNIIYNRYTAVVPDFTGSKNSLLGSKNSLLGGSQKILPNNINNKDIEKKDLLPTEDMVAYCEEFGLMPAWVGWGGNRWIQFYKDDELCSPDYLREIGALKERKVAPRKKEERVVEYQPWGWLSPTGEFSKGDFGDHEQVAYDIMRAKGWEDEFDNWDGRVVGLGRDFLTGVKGYVLLHNPTGMPYTIVSHEKPLTKAQKEFLYDYFMKEGDKARANSFFED